MKKLLSLLIVCALCLSLTACGGQTVHTEDEKLTIVATIFPEYDWLRNLTAGSENIELKLLIDKGVDLHSYQPNVNDIVTISTCDVFVYTGGASDVWVEDALETAMNDSVRVVDLMALLGQERELCHEDDHDHDHGEEDHEHAADEHVWLSLVNAEILCHELTHILEELDEDNAALYHANYEAYSVKLRALDADYRETVEAAKHHHIVFADRFPFTYLMEDYGLQHHAAYEGCSAETEVSFETFARLAAEIEELGVSYVAVIDDSDLRIANTVISASGNKECGIVGLQTMQAIGRRQINNGITYLGVMEENLAALQQVLN